MSLVKALGLDAHLQLPRMDQLRTGMIGYIQIFHSSMRHQQRNVAFNDCYPKNDCLATDPYRDQ